jgi:arylsulfatase
MVRWPGLVLRTKSISTMYFGGGLGNDWSRQPASPDVKNKLLQGYDAAGKNFKVHLDGYDQRDLLAARPKQVPGIFLLDDDGNLPGCATTNGRPYSWNRRPMGSTCGRS